MKKILFTVFAITLIQYGWAFAATSGFSGDCDACVSYLSCVSNKIMTDLSKLGCDQITSEPAVSAFRNYDESNAVNACKYSYTAILHPEYFGDVAKNYVKTYLYDTCTVSSVDLPTTNQSVAAAYIDSCYQIGYCNCDANYYIQPRNINVGLWGTDSECKRCPDDGAIDGTSRMFLSSCYKSAGAFTDATGSGKFTDRCYASFDNEEEAYNSWL